MNPPAHAYLTVMEVMERGLAKGHEPDGWKHYALSMHLQKAARHSLTCLLLLEHPEHCQDVETALEHAAQALTRMAMAVHLLKERGDAAKG